MVDIQDIRILNQYIEALEEANANLEAAFAKNDFAGVENIKKFILDVKSKIDMVLAK